MITLIQSIVSDLERKDLNSSIFIFPTKRACSAFKLELANRFVAPFKLPKIITWQEWLDETSISKTLTKNQALIKVFELYENHFNPDANFKQFAHWGTVFLSDINQIQRLDLDGELVFKQTEQLMALSFQNLGETAKSEMAIFWKMLPQLYRLYSRYLLENNHSSFIDSSWELVTPKNILGKKMVFCGFTVFSVQEKKVIAKINELMDTICYYDSPTWSGVTKNHESNQFLQELSSLFGEIKEVHSEINQKRIKSIACSHSGEMIKVSDHLLSQLSDQELDKTALILLDEAEFPLLLNSLSPKLTNANVGFGKPFLTSSYGALIQSLIDLWQALNQSNYITASQLIHFLDNHLLVNAKANVAGVKKDLVRENRSRLRSNEVFKYLKSLNDDHVVDVFEQKTLLKCLSLFVEAYSSLSFLKPMLFEVRKELEILAKEGNHDLGIAEYFTKKELLKAAFGLKGKREESIQILGLLETRAIDFDKVIILSAFEDKLGNNQSTSLIPFELQRQYGFPDYYRRDGLIAYHLMRLLKRSADVSFIYSNSNSGINASEPTHFVLQAAYEWSRRCSNVTYENFEIKSEQQILQREEFEILKEEHLLNDMREYLFNRGLSPSALNVYLSNPLDFYVHHELKLYEEDTIDKDIESHSLGTVIHKVLDSVLAPFVKREIANEEKPDILSSIEKLVFEEIHQIFPGQEYLKGQVSILFPVVISWIKEFLEFEIQRLVQHKILILQLEQRYRVKVPSKKYPILIKGEVDRIDFEDGIEHIIDYKTGKVEQKDLILSDKELIEFNPKKTKAYQLLLYAYAYLISTKKEGPVKCKIYSFRNQQAKYLFLKVDGEELIDKQMFQNFSIGLESLANKMLVTDLSIRYLTDSYVKFEL